MDWINNVSALRSKSSRLSSNRSLPFGYTVKEILILFSFDEEYGDIVFNFPENEPFQGESTERKRNCKELLKYFAVLKEKFGISKVRIRFEPAADDDTCLIELNEEIIDIDVLVEKMLTKSEKP